MTRQGRMARALPSLMTALILSLVAMLIATASSVARADETKPTIDTEASAQLDVTLGHGGQPVPGMRFDLFRVGEVSVDGTMHADDRFADILTDDMIASSHIPSSTIGTVAKRCDDSGMAPAATGETDAQGCLTFGTDGSLHVGLYIVTGRETKVGDETYETLPFLVWLPQWDERTGQWLYWVVASPKPEVVGEGDDGGDAPDEPSGGNPDNPSKTPTQSTKRNMTDMLQDLVKTGGIPILAGVILLVATLVEVVITALKKRAEG